MKWPKHVVLNADLSTDEFVLMANVCMCVCVCVSNCWIDMNG